MFLLFTFDDYYPCGGLNDFAGKFDTLDAAVSAGLAHRCDDFHVAEVTSDGRIIRHEYQCYRSGIDAETPLTSTIL